MKQHSASVRLIALALLLAMLSSLLPGLSLPALAAETDAATEAATVNNISNGHRDIFSGVANGETPADWTGEDWSVTVGSNIGTWGGDRDLATGRQTSWDHHLHYTGDGTSVAAYNKDYTDFDYTSHVMISEDDGRGGMVFWYEDENNYYFYRLTAGEDKAELGKVVNGEEQILQTATTAVSAGSWYNLRVQTSDGQIVCKITTEAYYIDRNNSKPGTVLFDYTAEADNSGKCGYVSYGADAARFCVFAVSNTAVDFTIENDTFSLTTGAYGQIKSLLLKDDEEQINFVGNEESHRSEVGCNKWLGELLFTYQKNGETKTASTGASEDNRTISVDPEQNKITVSYTTPSTVDGGLDDLQVIETYSLTEDHVQMDITVKNASSQALTIQDLGMPITWNNHWQFQNPNPYENYLAAAGNYISYDGSYVLLERGGGGSQKLLFTPVADSDAKFEYRKFSSYAETFTNPPEIYYIYSDAVKSEGQSYLPNHSLELAAGESETYSFRFHELSDDYSDVGDTLYEEGNLDVTVNPGMIMPSNITAKVDIHTKENVTGLELLTEDKSADFKLVSSGNGHYLYEITFRNAGRNDVQINYGAGKKSVLQFWIQGDLKEALQTRANFLMNNLRITDPSNNHCYSFQEINNNTNVAYDGGTNRCNNNDFEQMYDGPAFLAEKNVYYPVQEEITAVDDYLTKLVWEKEMIHGGEYDGYLSHDCCGNPCWSDSRELQNGHYVCTRSFNYPRIYNTFWSMYKIADQYPSMTVSQDKTWYLEAAGRIAVVGTKLSGGMGTMGEQTVADILAALQAEGLTELAQKLEAAAQNKANQVNANPYPFGSEFGTDSTAEEGAYFFAKMYDYEQSMERTLDKAIAWKGKSNVWYWQCTGNRQDNDWWLFQYTVGLHGAVFNDWYFNYVDNAADYWSMVYPFKMAPFVHIKTSTEQECNGRLGTDWWCYQASTPYNWENDNQSNGTYNVSGEADISLWAGLQILSADVVRDDPAFGTVGYGCQVTDNGDTLTVEPQDGLYRRLNVVGAGFQLELRTDRYTQAQIPDSKAVNSLTLTLENATDTAHTGEFTVRNMPAGTYKLLVDGALQAYVNVTDPDAETTVAYQINESERHTLSLVPTEGSVSLKVAVVGDETVLGEGTSNWEENGIATHLETALTEGDYEVETFAVKDATLASLTASSVSGITQYDPNMVVVLAGANDVTSESFVTDYEAVLASYQAFGTDTIVYAVTLPVLTDEMAAANEAIRTAAGNEQAVVIDLYQEINEDSANVQSNGYLDNNGSAEAAGFIYNVLTARAYVADKAAHAPYTGINAVDFDVQSGAQYRDTKETSASGNVPYVEVTANGYIGFEDVGFERETNKVTLTVKSAAQGAISVYKDSPSGTRIGYVTVNTSGAWENLDIELPAVMGTCDVYLVAEENTVSIQNFVFFENLFPTYSTDFSDDAANASEWAVYNDWGSFTFANGTANATAGTKIVVNNKVFGDFTYEAEVTVTNEQHAGQYSGLIFRTANSSNTIGKFDGYGLTITPFSNKVSLTRYNSQGDEAKSLAQWTYTLDEGTTYRLKVEVKGDTITAYLDGNLIGTYRDEGTSILSGSVGLINCDGAATFDNVNVQGIADGPAIETQPEAVTCNEGETATFTVAASPSGEGNTLRYQWQRSTDRAKWDDIAGATAATYTTPTLAVSDNGVYYRCVVSEGEGAESKSTNSDSVLLTVNGIPVVTGITVSPETATVRQGDVEAFTATVTGSYNPDQSVTWTVSGNTSSDTAIDADGTLFVAVDEAAETLTVTAISNHDATKSATATVTVQASAPATEENIALYLEFDSTSGNEIKDYSPNGYKVTMNGTVNSRSWTEDGFAFVGDNYMKLTGADLVSPNMTIVYEVTRTGDFTGAYSFFWGMNQADWAGSGIWVNSSDAAVYVATDGANNFQTIQKRDAFFPVGETVEVAITVNSDTGAYAIYRNGVKVKTTDAQNINITVPSQPYNTIGMAGYDNEHLNNFTMGKYMIFNTDLSAADVKAVYEGKFAPEGGEEPEPEFVAVTDITNVPSAAVVGFNLDLSRATVNPANATNKTITWSVKEAGATGAVIENNVFSATAAGTATITATIANGAAEGDFTKDFTIAVTETAPVFVPVSDITGVPSSTVAGEALTLTGSVAPATATHQAISWRVVSGSATLEGNVLTADAAGEVTVQATIANGKSETEDFTQNFTITVTEAETEVYTVNVLGSNHSQPGSGSYAPGETVTIKAGSRSGYRFGGWVTEDVVLDDSDSATTTFLMPEQDVTVRAKWILVPGTGGGDVKPPINTDPVKPDRPDMDFADVATTDWYAEAVEYVAEAGIMTGVAEGKFAPDASVTRAMVWTVLARLDGETVDGTGSAWYTEAQGWAVETGVSDGTDPMGSITREQLAAMLYRAAGSPAVSGSLSAYPDAASVSDWAVDAMLWATQTGLIDGMNGRLNPTAGATRAQLATLLMRFQNA